MSESELYEIIKELKLPCAYNKFDDDNHIPPFILYRNDEPESFFADDKNYINFNNYVVDLVTTKKDVGLEKKLEKLFLDHNIPFEKNEEWIDTERIFQISYYI